MKFLRNRRHFRLIALGFFLFSAGTLQAQYTGNPRIDNFLKALSTFPTAYEAKTAFQAAKFTASEVTQLQTALKNPFYSTQLTRLSKTVATTTSATKRILTSITALKNVQTQRIATINQKVKTEAQSLLSLSVVPSKDLQILRGTPPRITSLSQSTIEPGQYLIIRGADFLPQGSILFTFGSFSCAGTVDTWANDYIVTYLPYSVQGLAETVGKVIVRKPVALSAEAQIKFVPIWEFADVTSDKMSYDSAPWDLGVALIKWLVGITKWCSTYDVYYSSIPSYNLLNTWELIDINYNSEVGITAEEADEYTWYLGEGPPVTSLPNGTRGELCQDLFANKPITCLARIKGPRGLAYK